MKYKKENIKSKLFALVALSIIVSAGVTYAVIYTLIIEPLEEKIPVVAQHDLPSFPNVLEKDAPKSEDITSAGALIIDCHNGLPVMLGVLHDKNGKIVFSPPAGKSDENEDAIETAVRETIEETGYSVIGKEILGKSPIGNKNFSLILAEIDKSSNMNHHSTEVLGILWANPIKIQEESWRFPEQREWIINLFEHNYPATC